MRTKQISFCGITKIICGIAEAGPENQNARLASLQQSLQLSTLSTQYLSDFPREEKSHGLQWRNYGI